MIELSEAQRALLVDASTASDGVAADAPHPMTAKALIKKGLLISLPIDGAPSRLVATNAGREAVAPSPEPSSLSPSASTADETAAPEATDTDGPAPAKKPKGKIALLVELLRRPTGASIAEMMAATGWQPHSVRGAISGAIGKGLGMKTMSEKKETGRTYRIGEGGQ